MPFLSSLEKNYGERSMPLKSGLQENKRRHHSQPHDETSEKSSVILSARPPPAHLLATISDKLGQHNSTSRLWHHTEKRSVPVAHKKKASLNSHV